VTSASGASWSCATSGQDVTCLWQGGAVQPGQTLPGISVATSVEDAAVGTIVNTGVVKTPGDVNATNDTSTVKTPVTKVLGEKIPQTPSTPSTPSAGPSTLPFTGGTASALLPVAGWMMLAGGLLVLAGRRRRRA
jgi:LPXTG-motif cell wall-anchored protein